MLIRLDSFHKKCMKICQQLIYNAPSLKQGAIFAILSAAVTIVLICIDHGIIPLTNCKQRMNHLFKKDA